jgi:3-hydroxyisobutyrate dehydrogenase-like beta-hydroxyacid dehydrogenase
MSSESRATTIGFVGLGSMGSPMAANLLRAGHPLVVFDINQGAVKQAVELGARAATSAAEVARAAGTVISMVDTTDQALEVILGPAGFIETVQPGDLVISMSTIDPMALRRMSERLAEKGVDMIDAAVSGMDKGAKEGTLKAFVGGTEAALERARPILQVMAAEITHIGGSGQGAAMKLINNMLFQVARITIAEALVVGTKAGIKPRQLFAVISKATGNSVAFQSAAPRMLDRNFVGSRLDSTFKDMELQTQLGKSLQVPMFMANIAQQVCEMGRASALGDEDGAAIIKVYEQLAKVTVGDPDS